MGPQHCALPPSPRTGFGQNEAEILSHTNPDTGTVHWPSRGHLPRVSYGRNRKAFGFSLPRAHLCLKSAPGRPRHCSGSRHTDTEVQPAQAPIAPDVFYLISESLTRWRINSKSHFIGTDLLTVQVCAASADRRILTPKHRKLPFTPLPPPNRPAGCEDSCQR